MLFVKFRFPALAVKPPGIKMFMPAILLHCQTAAPEICIHLTPVIVASLIHYSLQYFNGGNLAFSKLFVNVDSSGAYCLSVFLAANAAQFKSDKSDKSDQSDQSDKSDWQLQCPQFPPNQNHQLNWWYAPALEGHITGSPIRGSEGSPTASISRAAAKAAGFLMP
jgi:hypothetical protein